MAKKQSASMLKRLRKLIQPTPEKPEAPEEGVKRSERHSTGSSAKAAATGDASATGAPEHDRKQTPKQPWYRHRQRW